MRSAEESYVDPSALRSLYVRDDRSARVAAWRARLPGSLPVTRFARAELVNAIQLAVFRREIDSRDARDAIADFHSDLERGALSQVDLSWRHTLDLATDLSTIHAPNLGVRALDVLHVASALSMKSRAFVTYDKHQAALAKAVKLRVLSP